jgi:hypothetical protein
MKARSGRIPFIKIQDSVKVRGIVFIDLVCGALLEESWDLLLKRGLSNTIHRGLDLDQTFQHLDGVLPETLNLDMLHDSVHIHNEAAMVQ